MITHQTPEQILQAATPEQKLLWNYIYLTYGERCAASQYVFDGALAGSEITVFVPGKLFLAYQLTLTLGMGGATISQLQIFNPANALSYSIGFNSAYWDATAAAVRYIGASETIKNIFFGRVANAGGYDRVQFIGYRITY